MSTDLAGWEKAVDFHGHVCPGLAIGYRAAVIALETLGAERAVDEEMVAVVENDACGVDGVQVVTGCTFGKGNLVFRDRGKQAFTFFLRSTGSGVRVAFNYGAGQNEEQVALREKVFGGGATSAERERFRRLREEAVRAILTAPADQYFTVRPVAVPLPEKARFYRSVQCVRCGEGVMEPRARLQGGLVFCLDCAGEYKSRVLAFD